ncbi:hypothetical protein PAXINDRAFT_93163, partial [Paxillus involutus ATCC 200175]
QGRAAARDYEPAVQQILKIATGLFRSRLTAEGAYPDRMAQIAWAKEAWLEACQTCEAQILFNDEIIQLVYEDVPRSGLYEHRIIQKAINIAYYCNKKDEGVVYSQYFQPFPLRGVALMLTVVC